MHTCRSVFICSSRVCDMDGQWVCKLPALLSVCEKAHGRVGTPLPVWSSDCTPPIKHEKGKSTRDNYT